MLRDLHRVRLVWNRGLLVGGCLPLVIFLIIQFALVVEFCHSPLKVLEPFLLLI
jgi:hypothetical protein